MTYPPTAGAARWLSNELAVMACEVHVEVPGHFLSGSTANIPGIIAGETEKSRKSARDMLAAFDAAAQKFGFAIDWSEHAAGGNAIEAAGEPATQPGLDAMGKSELTKNGICVHDLG